MHAERTRWLAIAVAGGLAGASVAWALALAAPWCSAAAIALGAALASALPWWGLGVARPAPGHEVAGAAAWVVADGALACASEAFARRAASDPSRARRWVGVPVRWALSTTTLAVGSALVAHALLTAEVRVLALTGDRLTVWADGRPAAVVDPARGESSAAGVRVRLPTGRILLEARSADGSVVDRAEVIVERGRAHLYAPGDHGRCFWTETAHPSDPAMGAVRRPLEGSGPFHALPEIDIWLAPLPAPAGVRTSGGAVTALRQRPCTDAPVRAPELAPVPAGL